MSFHKNFWNVRTPSRSMGNIEYTAMPYWPAKRPKP
jgi:hypothetical protein